MESRQTAEIFTDKAKRLARTRIGSAVKLFSVRWSTSEPTMVAIQGLCEDDLDAFLLTLRLFVQDNEPISLRRFCTESVPELGLSADDIRAVNEIRDRLNAFLDSRLVVPCQIPALNVEVSSYRSLLHTYLYGYHAHTSLPHFRVAAALNAAGICRALMTCFFLHAIQAVAAAVSDIATIVNPKLDRGLKQSQQPIGGRSAV